MSLLAQLQKLWLWKWFSLGKPLRLYEWLKL